MSVLGRIIPQWLGALGLGEPDVGNPNFPGWLNDDERKFADLIRDRINANPDNVAVCSYLAYEPDRKNYNDVNYGSDWWLENRATGPMCVVGCAIWDLLSEVQDVKYLLFQFETMTAIAVFDSGQLPGTYSDKFIKLVNHAQYLQDSGTPWKFVLEEFEANLNGAPMSNPEEVKQKYGLY